jgi:hypothetical protein
VEKVSNDRWKPPLQPPEENQTAERDLFSKPARNRLSAPLLSSKEVILRQVKKIRLCSL